MTESEIIKTLVYEDETYVHDALRTLNALRQNKHFCDVVLQIGTFEVHAHRAVLASASPYLFELFTSCAEGTHEFRYKLNGGFEKDAFEKLIDYAYTARLEIKESQVKAVYMTANRLKMAPVMRQCGVFLVDMLEPDNCIGIRSIPGVCNDSELVGKVDAFILKQVAKVIKSKEYLLLPSIQVEVLRKSKADMTTLNERHICNLVVDWIRQNVDEDAVTIEQMTQKMHMLYVNSDNVLHDCYNIQSGDADNSEIIEDYKRMSKKLQAATNKSRKKSATPIPAKPRHLLYSRSLSDETPVVSEEDEREWHLIASTETGECCTAAIAMLSGRLSRISVMLRLNSPKEVPPNIENNSPVTETKEGYKLLPPMSSARCAVGAVDLKGNLLVCGGYDRGECLKTAQLYDPLHNHWTVLKPMIHARGRFDMTVIGDKAYAIGGSDGINELASVECFDSVKSAWVPTTPLPMARSNQGVCSLGNKIYCIGGWNGQVGIKRCDLFDPETKIWTEVASLQMGRYQTGVCALNNHVYAVGGCDAWNCINSVEKYDPLTDSWDFVAPLHSARRGCGLAAYNGRLYAVGGNDGTHSLCSVEIYDPETNTWSSGPKLTKRRANVAVAVVGNRLYAVGGFTGKTFINTIEILDPQTNEWTMFTSTVFDITGANVNQLNGGGDL